MKAILFQKKSSDLTSSQRSHPVSSQCPTTHSKEENEFKTLTSKNRVTQELQRRFWGKATDTGFLDFVVTFEVNNRPIYMALCSQLVLLDTVSGPSIVDEGYRGDIPRSYSMRGQMTFLASSSLPLSIKMFPHFAMAIALRAGPSV